MSTERKKILISPSLIASDLTTMGEQAALFDPETIDLLHLDVMDGAFVPNLTFGPGYIQDLKKHTVIPLDTHLMIERPERSIEQYININPWCITIHYESTRFPARILQLIRSSGIIAGLALNPATPVEAAFDLMSYADMILIMSVDPGFYGQSFMTPTIGRIKKLAEYKNVNKFEHIRIQVDGGINSDNIASIVSAGAEIIVAGNSAFKGGNINSNVKELRKTALRAT